MRFDHFAVDYEYCLRLFRAINSKRLNMAYIDIAQGLDTRHLNEDLATIIKAVAGGSADHLEELNDEVFGLLQDYLESSDGNDAEQNTN